MCLLCINMTPALCIIKEFPCFRGSEVFSIRINTAASSEAEFVLQYEELLVRRRSTYTHKLNLNPGAVVEDLQVDVKVVDPQGVVRESAPDFATSNRISENELAFSYRPTPEQQREDSADFGLSRDLNIEFDVNPSPVDVGDFVVDSNCYFVQFFSRSDAVPVPVDLVFVIDVSGSMFGVKIQQTREALETIINQLRNTDRFTMLTFSDDVKYWKRELVLVSEHREEGVKFAQGLATESSTNFNDGLLQGADVLKASGRSDHVPLLVMLTDGVPTSGVTNENEIVKNARSALADTSISLNCLGFGQYLNFQLLEKLALQNRGTVRTIYEGSDAADQLEGFFDEISTPVLRNIRVSYDSGSIELVSNREFPLLFRGGEIVVAGQCNEGSEYINVEVTATGDDGGVSFTHEVSTSPTDTVGNYSPSPERLLAYLLIQQLLDSRLTLTDEAQIKAAVDEALELSLKYNFVTDLTSLIVVEEKADGGSGSSNDSVIGDRDDGFGLEEVDIAFSPGQPANSGDYGGPIYGELIIVIFILYMCII